jgi:hypothetical protein
MKSLKESILSSTNTGKAGMLIPKTKKELIKMIKKEIKEKGLNCDLNHIKTHKITDMSFLFANHTEGYGFGNFNGDISKWDVSNVKTMKSMFEKSYFNQPINDWKISKVENMSFMFLWTKEFNQPLDKWNVSNVKHMTGMFQIARTFNQDISMWKINSNCITFGMFDNCNIKEEYKPFKNDERIK